MIYFNIIKAGITSVFLHKMPILLSNIVKKKSFNGQVLDLFIVLCHSWYLCVGHIVMGS